MSAPAGSPSTAPPTSDSPSTPTTAEPRRVVRRSGRTPLYVAAGVVVIVAILVGVGAATSWYGLVSSKGSCPSGVTIQGAGASFPAALISVWTSEFRSSTSNLVNYVNSGAGTGITDLTDKTVDFAVTDEPLNATETSALNSAVGTPLTLPVTGGAVSIIYNIPGYSGPLNLTGKELANIYLGTTTLWNDTTLVANNPGLVHAKTAITPIHRSDAAGMSYVLSNFLSDVSSTWSTNIGTSILPAWPKSVGEPASGNKAMISLVSPSSKSVILGAIGYTDLYDAEVNSLPSALIQNSQGNFIAPSVTSTTSAVNDIYNANPSSFPPSTGNWAAVSFVNASGSHDYPLATLVYMMIPENVANGYTFSFTSAQVLVEWIHWTLTTGQSFNQTAYPYIDPPTPLVSQALSGLGLVHYNSQAVSVCP